MESTGASDDYLRSIHAGKNCTAVKLSFSSESFALAFEFSATVCW